MTSAPPIERTAGAPLFSNNKLSVLRKHPYFADLEPEAFDQLCRYAKHITLKRGTAIFSKGDPGTSLIAVSMILASGLSFLGLGVKPPEPEWGLMLNTLRTAIYVQPWIAALPGVMIFFTSIAFNLLSDGLRSAMEIKQ
jgi:hypothetical protein